MSRACAACKHPEQILVGFFQVAQHGKAKHAATHGHGLEEARLEKHEERGAVPRVELQNFSFP